jgi:CheY-like chemotaxis protein
MNEREVMKRNKSVVLIAGLGTSRRLLLINALQRHGYETIEAQDGFEALQTAIDRSIDVLIADDEMPGLTGRELIGIVRKHKAIGHCLLTSAGDKITIGDTAYTDMNAPFVMAPFEPERLLTKIDGYCAHPSRLAPQHGTHSLHRH